MKSWKPVQVALVVLACGTDVQAMKVNTNGETECVTVGKEMHCTRKDAKHVAVEHKGGTAAKDCYTQGKYEYCRSSTKAVTRDPGQPRAQSGGTRPTSANENARPMSDAEFRAQMEAIRMRDQIRVISTPAYNRDVMAVPR